MKNTKWYGVARKNKIEVKRFGKFAVVGLSGLLVDYVVLNFLTYFLQVETWVALPIAFVAAATNNFVWNRWWVYPESRHVKKRKQMPVFLGVNAMGLGINYLIFFLFSTPIEAFLAVSPIALVARHHKGIGLNITKGIAAIVVMFWNYFVNRVVTFRNVAWQTNTGAPLPLNNPADNDNGSDNDMLDSAL
jgi:putative flippase GtrA